MRFLFIVLLILMNLVVFWKGQYGSMLQGNGDFWDAKNYLRTISDLQKGAHPYELPYMETLGPPLVIAPYLPLHFLPGNSALQFFTAISLVSGVLACFLLAKQFGGKQYRIEKTLVLSTVLFSAFPTRFNFITGQWGLVMVLLITVLMVASRIKVRSRLLVTAVALGLLIVIKTFFVFSLLSLLKKNLVVVLLALTTMAAVVLVLSPILKLQFYGDYQQRFSGVMWQPDRVSDLAYYNQSLKTTLSRVGLVESSVVVWVLISVIVGGYLFISGNIAAAIVLSTVLSPVAWQHYYVACFPLYVLALSKVRSGKQGLVWLVAVGLWWIEFPWLHHQPLTWWWGIVASHYCISGMLLSGILVYNHHHES